MHNIERKMCNTAIYEFFIENIDCSIIRDKRVLEVGSRYVNGRVRPLIEKFCHPREYIGIDIEKGRFVDIILPAGEILEYFGEEAFDVVISTEVLEHVKDWRSVIKNIKGVVKKGGLVYITTRSIGFPFHSYPYDYWRYQKEDMEKIFSDFEIITLKDDPLEPGVFLIARKPYNYKPVNLENIALYSMVLGRRTEKIVDINEMPVGRKIKIYLFQKISSLLSLISTYFLLRTR